MTSALATAPPKQRASIPTPLAHLPVLERETVAALAPQPDGRFLDGTFGGGGHTLALLAASAPSGQVVALDVDPAALPRAASLAADPLVGDRITFIHGNFGDLADLRQRYQWPAFDGILFDLGLSSFQLDDPARGFAFRFEGPLDMRFNSDAGVSAAELVRDLDEASLADVIRRFGEDHRAQAIARAIVRERARSPITTTTRLAEIVSGAVGGRRGAAIHPATRTFQALRIEVNRELDVLERGVVAAIHALAPGGRLVTIAFHSLEDRLVKRVIERASASCVCPPELPICICATRPLLRRIGKPIRPDRAEQAANPRARSAIMRVAERTDVPVGDGVSLP
ncbi:MAG: 16S rRNA (cytosine(1402)-N(4))-methyltransferase RsmH [Chloroflexia bacterium]|nr:16S rRNA (cytosine(1402)-N(4))-methyltransferase RsmH [Chloroflexia bacterium]